MGDAVIATLVIASAREAIQAPLARERWIASSLALLARRRWGTPRNDKTGGNRMILRSNPAPALNVDGADHRDRRGRVPAAMARRATSPPNTRDAADPGYRAIYHVPTAVAHQDRHRRLTQRAGDIGASGAAWFGMLTSRRNEWHLSSAGRAVVSAGLAGLRSRLGHRPRLSRQGLRDGSRAGVERLERAILAISQLASTDPVPFAHLGGVNERRPSVALRGRASRSVEMWSSRPSDPTRRGKRHRKQALHRILPVLSLCATIGRGTRACKQNCAALLPPHHASRC